MRIEAYFDEMRTTLETCTVVQSSEIAYDKRSTHEGYLRGEIFFLDGSVLHFREYVDVEGERERISYTYQYMDSSGKLVFRYDNTGHHRRLNLPTYHHHRHEGKSEEVMASPGPDLAAVLHEIEGQIDLGDGE